MKSNNDEDLETQSEPGTVPGEGCAAMPCSLSVTPEVDASVKKVSENGLSPIIEYCYAEDARKLERDRDHARSQWCINQDRLAEANELLADIMRGEVNPEDEAEKWLRTYCPSKLFPEND